MISRQSIANFSVSELNGKSKILSLLSSFHVLVGGYNEPLRMLYDTPYA